MDDSKLLELAGLAAGETYSQERNPLERDDLALRLVATLGIDLEWRADGRLAAFRHGHCFTAFESSREDRAANVRRAIVRAAAEIGRAKE